MVAIIGAPVICAAQGQKGKLRTDGTDGGDYGHASDLRRRATLLLS